mmetsp:Transcript_16825/g.39595  ORF Transcript_16825/g.39595 Transcript_16825/m.39595 type:complete len:231 (+) Transcript_16825:212-904(+)
MQSQGNGSFLALQKLQVDVLLEIENLEDVHPLLETVRSPEDEHPVDEVPRFRHPVALRERPGRAARADAGHGLRLEKPWRSRCGSVRFRVRRKVSQRRGLCGEGNQLLSCFLSGSFSDGGHLEVDGHAEISEDLLLAVVDLYLRRLLVACVLLRQLFGLWLTGLLCGLLAVFSGFQGLIQSGLGELEGADALDLHGKENPALQKLEHQGLVLAVAEISSDVEGYPESFLL